MAKQDKKDLKKKEEQGSEDNADDTAVPDASKTKEIYLAKPLTLNGKHYGVGFHMIDPADESGFTPAMGEPPPEVADAPGPVAVVRTAEEDEIESPGSAERSAAAAELSEPGEKESPPLADVTPPAPTPPVPTKTAP